ncbi:MAG TPA: hypothetical protein VGH79_01930 [Gaiellaceae bacterium]|jgi:hypothetical protein
MRALVVTVGFLAIAGIASAAAPQPTTLVRTPAPVKALAQDGGLVAWLGGDSKKCNEVHLNGNGSTKILPQPPTSSMTCRWAISAGTARLAIAATADAALWTLHESRSDFVMTAQVGGKEIQVDRLAHGDGTGWWLGGTTGGGSTLAYSAIDVEYVDPLACGSGGSCKKKIAGGGIHLVTAGQKAALSHAGPALGLSVSNGRIASIPATTVAKDGSPATSSGAPIRVRDVSNGALVSTAKPVGVPLAVSLSTHVLAVLSRNVHFLRLSWFDPATGKKLGGIGVPVQTTAIAANDQSIVYRFGRTLRALVLATRHSHPLGKTATSYLGLSLDAGRLVWAENHSTYGLIRALTIK